MFSVDLITFGILCCESYNDIHALADVTLKYPIGLDLETA